MNERLDLLLSGRRDGVLTPVERAELDHLLATSAAARQRAAALDRVDASLLALAAESVDAERLERGFVRLQRRVALTAAPSTTSESARDLAHGNTQDNTHDNTQNNAQDSAPESSADRRARGGPRRLRALAVGVAAAAAAMAAAWIAALVFPIERPVDPGVADAPIVAGLDSDFSADFSASLDEVAAEELATLGLEEAEDLEVIEELDLLEFLAAREPAPEGPRG